MNLNKTDEGWKDIASYKNLSVTFYFEDQMYVKSVEMLI